MTSARGITRLHSQVYECTFLDGAEQYIDSAFVEQASREAIYTTPDQPAYAGLDIGRSADLTVLVVVRVDRLGITRVVHVDTRKRTDSKDLHALADLACNTWKVKRLCIDSTGMGTFPASDIQRIHGQHRVECVDFTSNSKEDLATTMKQYFVDGRLRLPPDNKDLRTDVMSLRRLVTSAGNIRYDAPQTSAGHADRAWALALALHGCSRPQNTRTEV